MVSKILLHFKNGQTLDTETTPYPKINFHGLSFIEFQRDNLPPIIVDIPHDAKPIYRRRVQKHLDGTENVIYLLGWRKSTGNAIMFILDDGRIIMVDRFNEQNPAFIEPEWFPNEA